ncbi:MAG: 6-hydroxymethylpterin diphosphokinase MptE-like protein [Candidatus Hodarchaeota archaeon]
MDSDLQEQIDFYSEFKEWYRKIVKKFSFNHQKDCEARDYLSNILKQKSNNWKFEGVLNSFKNLIQEKSIILIYGCGPSLEDTVGFLLKNRGIYAFNNYINLAADGASVLLKELGIPIDAIFTDLDGITINEFNYSEFIVVHAHGDNIEKLKYFKKEILKFDKIIGTTQVKPLKNLINPGGFTDGDRILYFLRKLLLPIHKLFLIGMDFDGIIGKYSKPEMTKNQKSSPIKFKKLQFAVKLIEWLKKEIKNEIYFVNSNIVSKKYKYISIKEFEKLVFN